MNTGWTGDPMNNITNYYNYYTTTASTIPDSYTAYSNIMNQLDVIKQEEKFLNFSRRLERIRYKLRK